MTIRAERLAVSTLSRLNDMSGAGRDVDRLAFLRDTFDALLEGEKPPREFYNTKFKGQGFGQIGDYRVVKREERKSGRVYIQILDDSDGVGLGFTPRQVPKLIEALRASIEPVNQTEGPRT
jgi:hypothetical protein